MPGTDLLDQLQEKEEAKKDAKYLNPTVPDPSKPQGTDFSSALSSLNQLGIGELNNAGKEPDNYPDSWETYDKHVRPHLQTFTWEAERILGTWSKDPIVLCCLIRNLAVLGKLDDIIRKDGKTATNFLRRLLSVLDMIINFLKRDINARVDEQLDILKWMMFAVVGALVATMDALRQAVADRLEKLINKLAPGNRSIIKRCLPLQELINLILKVIQDPVNGLLSRVTNMLNDWVNMIKTDIHEGFNCGELIRGEEQIQSLGRERADLLKDIDRIRHVSDDRTLSNTDERIKNIDKQLDTIQSRMSLNKGVPLVGKAGCFLQKVEFLQKLYWFRKLIVAVIKGLDRGILCASLTPEMLLAIPDPLKAEGLGQAGVTPFNTTLIPYPTDTEIDRLLTEELEQDDDTARIMLDRFRAIDDPNRTLSDGVSIGDAVSDIQFIETVAACTEVLNDDIIFEFADALRRLETSK